MRPPHPQPVSYPYPPEVPPPIKDVATPLGAAVVADPVSTAVEPIIRERVGHAR